MTGPYRIEGGLIDRASALPFAFDGKTYRGAVGDTLASAMLANGIRLVGRSFKYHRPRGIFGTGPEEPNALMTLGSGARREPNARATTTELVSGIEARSQNHRGSLGFDVLAVNDLLAPFLGAGFYYKTFMWPKRFWEWVYEPIIRSAAGLGALSGEPDPAEYSKGYRHCDLLIIGAGPAGLNAALTAGRAGLRVILADEDFRLGGRLNGETHEIDGAPGSVWALGTVEELRALPNVQIMARTTVYGAYDHGVFGAFEKSRSGPAAVLWRIYAKRSILCAGSIERGIGFANNDRPGIMLAGAVRAYANRWAVAAGRSIAVFTNNDDGWRTAKDLVAKGVHVSAVIDPRDKSAPPVDLGETRVFMGQHVVDTAGRKGLKSITLLHGRKIEADCLAVSGGWSPTVHLTCYQRGRPAWNGDINGFVPSGELPVGMVVAGAANGAMTLGAALIEGAQAAVGVAHDFGAKAKPNAPKAEDEPSESAPFWYVPESKGRAWLDLQNDVTVKDVRQSHAEGFRSVEHLKRYTTLGMATDQGKTSNIPALGVLAEVSGRTMEDIGTTIFRPPYAPVPISAFAGVSKGTHFRPTRLPASHDWAAQNGASFTEAGLWMRAEWYARPGEKGWRDSVDREVVSVRSNVGICDVSTLGKIDVQGRDAAQFLDAVYTNSFSTLKTGRVRYGLMLREDGVAYDDGTTARMGDTHYVMTTTTANAGLVFQRLEFARQCLFPQMDVHLQSTTDVWAQFAVAGPNSRELLSRIVDDFDLSKEAFPFMACGTLTICGGVQARLFRISFSGELAYEIAVPTRYGAALFQRLMELGDDLGVTPYGLEALNVMRVEKGHVTGAEIDGRMTARNLGMETIVSSKKDCIGKVLAGREAYVSDDVEWLVGIRPTDAKNTLTAGAHLLRHRAPESLESSEGWITSVAYSPTLGYSIGLGFLKRGQARKGEVLRAYDPVRSKDLDVEIVSPHFVDPEGVRVRG